MKMIECENCGARFEDFSNDFECTDSGEEICPSCQKCTLIHNFPEGVSP